VIVHLHLFILLFKAFKLLIQVFKRSRLILNQFAQLGNIYFLALVLLDFLLEFLLGHYNYYQNGSVLVQNYAARAERIFELSMTRQVRFTAG